MSERDWLSCNDAFTMMVWIDPPGPPKLSDRKLRLFVAACCRERWTGDMSLLLSPVKRAIESLETFADGGDELAMMEAWDHAQVLRRPGIAMGTRAGTRMHAQMMADMENPRRLAARADLLRDIFGNPFRPTKVPKHEPLRTDAGDPAHGCEMCDGEDCCTCPRALRARCLTCGGRWPDCQSKAAYPWSGGIVRDLAKAIYDGYAFDRMPILGDALEDSGCEDVAILNHCRGLVRCHHCLGTGRYVAESMDRRDPVPNYVGCHHCLFKGWVEDASSHVRGCWVLDLVLGKV